MVKHQNKGAFESQETLTAPETFIQKYGKQLAAAVVVLVLIVGGYLGYKQFIAGPKEEKAATAMGKGQEYFVQQQFDKALNGDGAGYIGFAKIADEYSGTDAGNLANLYAGLCNAHLSKWEAAKKYLENYSPADDAMISPAAVAALGNTYAHLNQPEKAVEKLKKAASMADAQADEKTNNSIAPTFMLQAAIILESQNKKDEALKIYQEIKSKYQNSALVQSNEIDKYIERLSAK